jgi:ferritin-like metal-binding protein YciE
VEYPAAARGVALQRGTARRFGAATGVDSARQRASIRRDLAAPDLHSVGERRRGCLNGRRRRSRITLQKKEANVSLDSLQDLYVEELQDLYSAENQILKALPKMADAAKSDQLRTAFNEHVEVTREQVRRLESIFDELQKSPRGKHCKGMEGLISEGNEILQEDADPDVRDAALIAAAQRVEHYEIAGYGTVRTYAKQLGLDNHARLLQQTLEEEGRTDERLTKLAENRVNQRAEVGE